MQGFLRKKSNDQGFAGGEFCEVISTLTHDLTKARNQLVRLMNQVKPGGDRLYGGYNGPQGLLRAHTPGAGSNLRNNNRPPGPGRAFVCGKENPHRKSDPPQPQKPCRPMTVPAAARELGQPQQKVPIAKQKDKRPQQRASFPCEPHRERVQRSCEKPQQCSSTDMSDMTDMTDMTDRSGQSDSTCVNITLSPEPALERQHCCCNTNNCGGSKPVCWKSSRDLSRLQGGSDIARLQDRGRRCDMGTQFAAQLKDITFQLQERRLRVNPMRRF